MTTKKINYNFYFEEMAKIDKTASKKEERCFYIIKKSFNYFRENLKLTDAELAECVTSYLKKFYEGKETQIFDILVKYAKSENIKSLDESSIFGIICLLLEGEQKIDNIKKSFIGLLFTESEQEKMQDITKILTKLAENQDSNTKFINAIKKNTLLREMVKDVCGEEWKDATYKQFRNVQITNTKTITNKANLRLMYALTLKACYLQKYRNLSMKYATVAEIETAKLKREQTKANKSAVDSIKQKLAAMSKDDLKVLLESIQTA